MSKKDKSVTRESIPRNTKRHLNCVACLVKKSDFSAAYVTLKLLKTLETIPLNQVTAALCSKHKDIVDSMTE